MNTNTHRLQAGYSWEDLHAFLKHFTPVLACSIQADSSGRIKFRYQLTRLLDGKVIEIPVAESFYSLKNGWQYALPPGTQPGIDGAKSSAILLSKALTS